MQKYSLLADYADVRAQLSQDQSVERETLKQRDREIGLAGQTTNDVRQLRTWVATLRSGTGSASHPGAGIQQLIRGSVLALWACGGIIGWLLSRAVLYYDGQQPVNLFSTLLVLVGLQLFALVILVVLLLVRRPALLRALSIFNPATHILKLVRRFSRHKPDGIDDLFELSADPQAKKVSLSLIVYLAQHFSVALNIGMIFALVYLVTITDLAFGWNTTLKLDDTTVYNWFQYIAWPWHNSVTAAVPDLSLVEQSRFYRLAGQLRNPDWQVDQFGTWWLFVLMSLGIYGLLPRLAMLVICGARYDRAVSDALTGQPGASQALARMRSPLVSTSAGPTVTDDETAYSHPLPRKRQSSHQLSTVLVSWSGADVRVETMKIPGIEITHRYEAGGHQSLLADRQLAERVAQHHSEGVVVAVKAWEPPTLDFSDFLSALRQQLGAEPVIVVLLMAMDTRPITSTQLETWEAGLFDLADPALYVEAL